MLVAQPTHELPEAPFGAVAARQLSVWPFPTRTLRLFVLVDPSLPDPTPRHGLLRAMQQAYFRSDGFSQTRAVREAALAAHYVLQHHNRDVLPLKHVNAATAVAALRGDVAFVALAGDAAAFAWRDGMLTGQRGILRLPRPLGLEQDPPITLWSTRLDPADRLLLVCGAAWRPESQQLIEGILREHGASQDECVQEQLVAALSGSRAAGVLLADPASGSRPDRHLAVVSTREPAHRPTPVLPAPSLGPIAPGGRARVLRRMGSTLLAAVVFGAAAIAALNPGTRPVPPQSTTPQMQALQAQVDATSELDASDHVYRVSSAMAVQLGSSGTNIVDLAVGEDTLYTLDVVEAAVRAFPVDAREQQPTPDTLLVRAGAPIGSGAHPLATPVAIQYLSGPGSEPGVLAIVDQARAVVQVGRDRALNPRPVASSASWRELGALGADTEGRLYVLDSGSRRLLEYPSQGQRIVDPPRLLLDGATTPGLAFERAAEIVGQQDGVYLRMDDGTLRHFDAQGQEKAFVVRPADDGPPIVSAVTPDRAGGLYLADAAHARILQTTADGAVLRQLSNPALADVRQIRSSLDGQRLYGLVTSGVLVLDVPPVASQ